MAVLFLVCLMGYLTWSGRTVENSRTSETKQNIARNESDQGMPAAPEPTTPEGREVAGVLEKAPTAASVVSSGKDQDRIAGTASVTAATTDQNSGEDDQQAAGAVAVGPQLVLNAAGNAAMAELLAKPVDLSNPQNRDALVAQVKALEDAEKAAIETKARQLGIPTTLTRANGTVAVLRGFEDDRPVMRNRKMRTPRSARMRMWCGTHPRLGWMGRVSCLVCGKVVGCRV